MIVTEIVMTGGRTEPETCQRPYISSWLSFLLHAIHTVFMTRYFKIEISGHQNIPESGPFLVAPTHRSRWDGFLLYCAVKGRSLYFMSSHDEVAGLQGWFMKRMGSFPINTQRPGPSVFRICREIIARGDPLVIFPEGNLFYYRPGEVHPLKPGVARLALNSQKACSDVDLPVLPIRLVFGDRILRPGSKIKIEIAKPILVRDYLESPTKEAIKALTAALQESLGEIINETNTADSLREARLSR